MTTIGELETNGPYDLARTLRMQRFGGLDPTFHIARRDDRWVVRRATHSVDGPVVIEATQRVRDRIEVRATGPGASWVERHARMLFGLDDTSPMSLIKLAAWSGHVEGPRLVALARRHVAERLAWAPHLSTMHMVHILQQRVTWEEASRAYRMLVLERGERAPDGSELRLPLDARAWATLPSYEARRVGIDRHRHAALLVAARAAAAIDGSWGDREALTRVLGALRGTGPWTTAMTLGFGAADGDAVPTGDVHLPHRSSTFFRGHPLGDDAAMLEDLAPLRPHRFRVLRWIMGRS